MVTMLDPQEVCLWYACTDQMPSTAELHALESLLSAEERTRQRRFLFERDRHQFLIAHALVRSVLSHYATGVPAQAWKFASDPHGKPRIVAPAEFVRLHFNLAHTCGMAVCAVTWEREIGVDVEDVEGREIDAGLFRYCLTPSELAHLESLPAEQRKEAFFDYWTLKEAYLKARGLGLALPLKAFSFQLDGDGPPRVAFSPQVRDDPQGWQFVHLRSTPRHRIAVAVRRSSDWSFRILLRDAITAGLFGDRQGQGVENARC
jgi:4'-phosphopantetheinyl transferase